jgi:hypothetical protein
VTFLADDTRFHLISNNVGAAGGIQANVEVELDCVHSDSDPNQDGPETIVCKKKLGERVKGNGENREMLVEVTTTGLPVPIATVTLADEGVLPTTREARYSEAAEAERAEEGNGWRVTVGGWAFVGVAVGLLSQL